MDKNQSVIALIIIVLVVVCAFLYFVFKPQINDENMVMEDEGATYSFDVDGAESGVGEQGEIIAEIEEITKDGTKDEKGVIDNTKKEHNMGASSPALTSPDTGPGSIALIVATILGVVGAFGVHKKLATEKK